MMKSYQPLKDARSNLLGNGRASPLPSSPLGLLLIALFLTVLFPVRASAADPPIRLEVEGELVQADAPPFVIGGRTLVPVRFVAEALGAAVSWDSATQTVTVARGGTTAVLTIGETTALINGNPVHLDVPAQIASNRTFVPLRFVAESLGANVEWDGATRTVRVWRRPSQVIGLTWNRGVGSAELRVALSEPLASYRVEGGAGPNQLVLVMTPARAATDLIPPPDPLLQGVRLEEEGRNVRLILDLPHPVKYRLAQSPDGPDLILQVDYQVLGTEVRVAGASPEVWIHTDGPVSYQTLQLSDPARLVLDLPSTTLAASANPTLPVSLPEAPWLKGVRAAQFQVNPDVTRIVIELDQVRPYEVAATDRGLVIRFPAYLTGVRWENLKDRTRLIISAAGALHPEVKADGRLITFSLPDTRLGEGQTEYVAQGAAFSRLVLGQDTADSVIGLITLPYYLGHEVLSKPGDSELVIDLIASPVFGRKIWIDAGHGGSEPGARSAAGTLEKDITLAISLELMKQLQEAGAQVLMTRTDDSTVDLYDRGRLANAAGAEIFVSVHINSGPASATGTESYYWKDSTRSYNLAVSLQQQLVRALNLPDRGVKTANFVVLRETAMPASLVEIAFLSNPREEQLLLDPAFRRKAATALKDGILAYFWQEMQSKTP